MTTFEIYKKVKNFPFGNSIFTFFLCIKVPYFKSIKPKILVMEEGRVEATISQHHAIQNHIKTIHAIAVCNLCELAMGMLVEATIPDNLRWLPTGMDIKYLKKTTGIIKAITTAKKEDFKPGSLDIKIDIFNSNNEIVDTAIITINIKEKLH
jgi:acyl-coenzyme A thioesterase PaaI-like protein